MLKKTAGLFVAMLLTATSARGGSLEELLPSVPLDELERTSSLSTNDLGIIKETVHYRELDGRYCVHAVLKTFHTYEDDSWNEYGSQVFFNNSCDEKLDHLFVNGKRSPTIPELYEQFDALEGSSQEHLVEEQNAIIDDIIKRYLFENQYKNLYEREASRQISEVE